MDYKKDLEIGHYRAEQAAKAIRRWTGVQAMAVCALRPASNRDQCQPVGQPSLKEIVQDDGFRGDGGYYLLVVDEDGTAKACSKEAFPLCEVLRLAKRLPVPMAMPGQGELWRRLEEEKRLQGRSMDMLSRRSREEAKEVDG